MSGGPGAARPRPIGTGIGPVRLEDGDARHRMAVTGPTSKTCGKSVEMIGFAAGYRSPSCGVHVRWPYVGRYS